MKRIIIKPPKTDKPLGQNKPKGDFIAEGGKPPRTPAKPPINSK